ncbi:MAG: IS1634 family transposase [Bacteroidia bacterium]|nr:IS1634 family transposase [Bacteroidia bacterium]
MGVASYIYSMFLRKLKNRSGSVSVQIISKSTGKYKVLKTIGSSSDEQEVQKLVYLAKQEIERISQQPELFISEGDTIVEQVFSSLNNASIRTVGPEIIFGKIYDSIGFGAIQEELFRHLVLARLSFPLSKLKTIDYLYRFQGVILDIDSVYRFLDKLNNQLKNQVEQIAFTHTLNILQGNISIVFYDMTTLYFEASDEDDLRKTGFSKDGKHQNPQIFLGLLVGLGGYAIGYDVFEGNIYGGHTLIPFIEKISKKFNLDKPVIVADAGLLSNENIKALREMDYQYIIGARLKNESEKIKKQILEKQLGDGQMLCIKTQAKTRLIVAYATNRAIKDEHNRKRGLQRLEKQIKAGKLTKSNINNKGYNKYLRLVGDVSIEINYEKFNNDKSWDGLKGYRTNTQLSDKQVIENYKNLWHIEKAFRMSKTDLRIRPIYHRLRHRIEAHICISFTAYCIYIELERVLYKEKSNLSLKKSADLTHNMYQITYTLPESKHTKSQLLRMDDEQAELHQIINKNF